MRSDQPGKCGRAHSESGADSSEDGRDVGFVTTSLPTILRRAAPLPLPDENGPMLLPLGNSVKTVVVYLFAAHSKPEVGNDGN
jgi:hypothetical protein